MASRPSLTSVASPPEGVTSRLCPRNARFLAGLPASDLNLILAAAAERHFSANSIIANQGHPADHLFLLTKGYARHFYTTQKGDKVLLLWLVPGEIFGSRALLEEESPYLLSTEMVKDGCALAWRRNTIRQLATQYPRLLENALALASDYVAWFLAAHIALVSHSARERLAHVLVSLAQCIGHKVAEGVELDITNEQLANAANVTMFTASRLLSQWRRNGALLKSRGKVVLRAPERLFLHPL